MLNDADTESRSQSSSQDKSSSSSSSLSSSAAEQPVLERLIRYFVSAKRALSSTHHIWHANEIVTSSKTALEDIVTSDAQNEFLKRGVDRQISKLRSIHNGLEQIALTVQTEFSSTLTRLDEADARVKDAIEKAKTTAVEPSLRPADEAPRSLHDFVDEHSIDGLTDIFRKSIDRKYEAQTRFTQSNGELDSKLALIEGSLKTISSDAQRDEALHTVANFNAVESHASEMANLLQSLVHHYDLCVKALKHTEGGNEAAVHAQANIPTDVSTATIDRHAEHLPVSDEEHRELMQVLENDALEVEDVVQEIRERAIEMESQSEMITDQANRLREDNAVIRKVTHDLDDLGSSLGRYINGGTIFNDQWRDIKQTIEVNMEQLEGLCDFYSGFLQAYDGLLLEVARRRAMQLRISNIAQEAMSKVETLRSEDEHERQLFTTEHADFLPKDIWPNLEDPIQSFEVHTREASERNLPDLPPKLLQQAMRRRMDRRL